MHKLVGSFFNRHTVTRPCPCGQRFELPFLVGVRFQVYFTALTGLLFTFPSRYLFTIDHKTYLAFPDSPGCFLQDYRNSKYSRLYTKRIFRFRVQDFHPLWFGFPADSASKRFCNLSLPEAQIGTEKFPSPHRPALFSSVHILQPPPPLRVMGLGFSLFARRYLGNDFVLSSSAY